MEKNGKTRILSPGRSAGDGMDNIHFSEANNHQFSFFKNFYPQTFTPKIKEPKFVPYEPYKAATLSIVPHRVERICNSKDVIDSQQVSSLTSSIIHLTEKSHSSLSNAPKEIAAFPPSLPTCKECSEKECEMELLKENICNLEREKRELSAQYEAQFEVIGDLKKLLVAALGEDVEVRVGQLAEQKATLGAKLIELHSQLAESEQSVEQLQVQAALWEGKFQASSVLVQEVTLWKTSFCNRLGALSPLLSDYDDLFHEITLSHRILKDTLSAFDQKADNPQKVSPMNVVQLAIEVRKCAHLIHSRLLGKGNRSTNADLHYIRLLTPAENEANKIIQYFNSKTGSDQAKCDSGRIACQLLPHMCEADATLHFCKHCSGEVKTI